MTPRVEFLNISFDALASDEMERWIATRTAASPYGYIVTPNVDHVVRNARAGQDIRLAYAAADLCVCDSRVLRRLASLFGVALTVVPGSDLVAALFDRLLRAGDRVCLIGGSAEDAAKLQLLFPQMAIVHHAPPMGLRHDPAARAAAIAFAQAAQARVTLLAVGSPQQELLAHEMRLSTKMSGTALCIGASVDFLVGTQSRAPRFVQTAGLEWAWRLIKEPRRLTRRYLVEGPTVLPMAVRWWWAERGRS